MTRPGRAPRRDAGPGIVETTLVLGLSGLLAAVLLVAFGGEVANVISVLVDAAHGGAR